MEVPSKQTFDKYVQMGLLKSASSNGKIVYCYNEFCQYSQLWNQITRQARGIVFSEDGKLLQRCVPKFFNMGEREGVADYQTILNESVRANPTIEEKLDGCLIKVSRIGDELLITSKCSFDNEFVDTAKELISKQYSVDDFDEGKTYHFELLTEQTLTATVIDYGKQPRLVLWSIVDNRTGAESNIYKLSDRFEVPKQYDSKLIDNVDSLNDDGEVYEGVVLVFGAGQVRLKLKTAKYLKLFKTKNGLTNLKVWEALSNGEKLTHKDVPEEFWDWLDSTKNLFHTQFSQKKNNAIKWAVNTRNLSNKSIALSSEIPQRVKPFIFIFRKGNENILNKSIWRTLKPTEKLPAQFYLKGGDDE